MPTMTFDSVKMFDAIEGNARRALDKMPMDQRDVAFPILKDMVIETYDDLVSKALVGELER